MKQKTLRSLFLAGAFLSILPSFGSTDKEEWRLAVDILKGKDTIQSKEWAVQLLEASQEEEPDAFVKNVLGIAYLHGIGTVADTTKAVLYFNQAGELGYPLAYHNLGMYYKYAPSGKLDFTSAFEAFRKGAEAGSASNCYNTGFMLYKGLGCTQNYVEAIEQFRTAADRNHAPSLYMLGLCYRNGYGVEADTAIANAYLRQSADLGYADAMEELLNEMPENKTGWYEAEFDNSLDIPAEMPGIVPYLPLNNRVMSGLYKGLLVTYDWSGCHVVSETPLSVDMQVARDSAYGLWIQGNDSLRFAAQITDDGAFRFGSTDKMLYDRYSPNFYSHYRFEKIAMNYNRGFITGDLRLFSLDEMEPERPMYVCLEKDMSQDGVNGQSAEDEFVKIVAYSDPYSDRVTLKFELSEAVESVKVGIYGQNSLNVGSYAYGSMEAGVNTLTLHPNLSEGSYVIYVWAGTHKYQAVVVI